MGNSTPAYAFWKIVEVSVITGAGYMLLLSFTAAVLFGSFNPIVILWPALSGAIMGVIVGFSVAIPAVGLHLIAGHRSPKVRAGFAASGGALGPLAAYQFVSQSQQIDAWTAVSWILFLAAAALTAVHHTAGLRCSELRSDLARPRAYLV